MLDNLRIRAHQKKRTQIKKYAVAIDSLEKTPDKVTHHNLRQP
jgi:hypothetical protein